MPTTTIRVRRIVAGVSLVLFPLFLLLSEVADPVADDRGPAGVFEAAVDQHAALVGSAWLLIASSIFLVPAVFGIAHLIRTRGAWLVHFGVLFGVLGAFGHVTAGTYYLIASATRNGNEAEMVALMERVDSSGAIAGVFPLILSFAVGMLLLALAAWRARFASGLVPLAIVAALVLEFASPALPDVAALLKQALALVAFGWIGIRILQMNDDEWAHPAAQPAPAAALAQSPAHP